MPAPARQGGSEDARWARDLMCRATELVPFYRHYLADADPSDFPSLPSFDKRMTAGWGRFPISAGGPARAHRVFATSGTSGDRLCVAFDASDWKRAGEWLATIGRRAGLGPDDVLLNTHCYGLWVGGPALDQLAHGVGACLVPIGPDDPARVLEFLADGVGTALSATPSYLRRLVEAAEAAGFDLARSRLRTGFIGAEPAEQPLRDRLLSRLPDSFRWVELYGLTETAGPSVAWSAEPGAPELTLNVADFRVEVLDLESDRAAPQGAIGELTLTTREVKCRTPLIRYRTRDLVRVTQGDPDAPTRVSRILGRADHSLKICGVLVYPSSVAEIVSEHLPASAEWRAVIRRIRDDDELVIEAEAAPRVCATVEAAFQARLGLQVTVRPLGVGTLERSRAKTQRVLVEPARGLSPG